MIHLATKLFSARIVVGMVFVIAGIVKLIAAPAEYTVYGSLVSRWPWFAFLWPTVELLVGALLLMRFNWPIMRGLALLILSSFVAVLVIELFSSTPRSCGCIGTSVLPGMDPKLQIGLSLAVDIGLIWALAATASTSTTGRVGSSCRA